MFFTRGSIGVAATNVSVSLAVGAGTLVIAVVRRNAVFDTRLVPRTSSVRPSGAVVFILLEGRVVWHPTGEAMDAPCVFVVPDDASPEFERAQYRTEGEVHRAVEIHVSAVPIAAPHRGSASLIDAAASYHRACFDDALREERTARAQRLFATVREARLASDVGTAPDRDGPGDRMWQALASAVEHLDVGSTLAIVSLGTGVSERQARRDLQSTLERLRLPFAGFRDAAKRFRVRLALVLLSASGATIGEVARAVGYRHSEALANAFADAGLPAPGRVRRVLLSLMEGVDEVETLHNRER